jgi:hypothetical protein
MSNNKFQELLQEFRTVMGGRGITTDAILSPLVFVIINTVWGLTAAMWAALGVAAALTVLRLVRRQPWVYALGGMAGVALAIGLSVLTKQAQNFFLPTLISSSLTLLVCIISVVVRRPLAALASHLTRGWPLAWFWHPKVRPAYSEVTWIWAAYITLRLALQAYLYLQKAAGTLAWVNILTGWPVTIAVLAISYIFGIWRLQKLGGPGVDEFEQNAPPPWQGQKRGF